VAGGCTGAVAALVGLLPILTTDLQSYACRLYPVLRICTKIQTQSKTVQVTLLQLYRQKHGTVNPRLHALVAQLSSCYYQRWVLHSNGNEHPNDYEW
jgi:hypothetical protein